MWLNVKNYDNIGLSAFQLTKFITEICFMMIQNLEQARHLNRTQLRPIQFDVYQPIPAHQVGTYAIHHNQG